MLNHGVGKLTGYLTYDWTSLEWLIVVSHCRGSTQKMWSYLVYATFFLTDCPICLLTFMLICTKVEILFLDPGKVVFKQSADRNLSGIGEQES